MKSVEIVAAFATSSFGVGYFSSFMKKPKVNSLTLLSLKQMDAIFMVYCSFSIVAFLVYAGHVANRRSAWGLQLFLNVVFIMTMQATILRRDNVKESRRINSFSSLFRFSIGHQQQEQDNESPISNKTCKFSKS